MKRLGLTQGFWNLRRSRDNGKILAHLGRKDFIWLHFLSIHGSKSTKKTPTKQNSKPLWITIATLHNYTFIFSDFYLKAWFSGNIFLTFVVSLLIAETINKLVAETSSEQIYRRLSCIRLWMLFFLKIS